MVINTIYGTNSVGRAGPAASSPVFAADLNEVSTVVPGGSVTRQLTLNDLGTDCPQTAGPTEIATMIPGGHCDPILAAPPTVRSWASPCNACGRFGLFDPPYAVPTLSGGLLEPEPTTTTVTEEPPPPDTPTIIPPPGGSPTTVTEPNPPPDTTPMSEPDSSTVIVVPTDDVPDSSPVVSPTDVPESSPPTISPVGPEPSTATTDDVPPTSTVDQSPSVVPTAAATRVTGGLRCVLLGLLVSMGMI